MPDILVAMDLALMPIFPLLSTQSFPDFLCSMCLLLLCDKFGTIKCCCNTHAIREAAPSAGYKMVKVPQRNHRGSENLRRQKKLQITQSGHGKKKGIIK